MNVYRCSAASTLVSRRLAAADFASLVDAKRQERQGCINCPLPPPEDDPNRGDAFRQRLPSSGNLCILPHGMDAVELAGVRWRTPKDDESTTNMATTTNTFTVLADFLSGFQSPRECARWLASGGGIEMSRHHPLLEDLERLDAAVEEGTAQSTAELLQYVRTVKPTDLGAENMAALKKKMN